MIKSFAEEFNVDFNFPSKNLRLFFAYQSQLLTGLKGTPDEILEKNELIKQHLHFYIEHKCAFDGNFNAFLDLYLPRMIVENRLHESLRLMTQNPTLPSMQNFFWNQKNQSDFEGFNQAVKAVPYKDNCPYSERDLFNSIATQEFVLVNDYFLQSFGEYGIPSFYIGPDQNDFKFATWHETHGVKHWREKLGGEIQEPRQWIYRRESKMTTHDLWTLLLMLSVFSKR